MPLITLSNSKQFSSDINISLLDAARAQGFVLEHSCRTGRCGVCKAQVLSGSTRLLRPEDSLDNDDNEAGFILTCCRTAISDVVLGIEDLGTLAAIKTQTLPCKIDTLTQLAPDVMQVILRLPPSHQFNFLPGQYIDVIAKNGVRRSYSLASVVDEANKLELHVRAVEDGVMSRYWFGEAKIHDLLRLDGPHGTFFLRDKAEKNIIFLATGTGIAPVKSILEALENSSEQVQAKNIYVYWGGRVPEEFYWRPAFSSIDVMFCPVLSRDNEGWCGRYGYVQEALLANNIDLFDSVVYACGSNNMIHAAKPLLVAHGLKPDNFYSDAFVSS